MRAPASAGPRPAGLAALLAASALAASAAALPLPEIASVRAPDCVDAGSQISVSGQNFGRGTSGWKLELAGVTLETREWKDDRIRAEVPAAIREVLADEKPDLILRSLSGALLARARQSVRLCARGLRDPAPAPEDPDPVPESPPKRGIAPRARDAQEPPLSGLDAESSAPALDAELLIGVPDLATATAVERSALALGPQEPARRSELGALGFVMVRLRFADRGAADAAARRLRELYPQLSIARNHVYKREDGFRELPAQRPILRNRAYPPEDDDLRSASLQLRDAIHWPRDPACGRGRRVGIVDTGVDTAHPELRAAHIVANALLPGPAAAPDATQHGTAVASLLVGKSLGLIPGAELYAASVFWTQGDEVVSSAEQIVRGIAWLVSQQVDVINLSLTGPPNPLVADALRRARERGIPAVAAAGNAGPEQPVAFPASLADVVAVTAVDVGMRIYPRAARGAIDLAAPGVDILVAGTDGTRQSLALASGTSYAVPFVAAALALRPRGLRELEATALDLGSPGQDPIFGWGLLQADGLCVRPSG